MTTPSRDPREAARLRALHELDILDTPPEAEFEEAAFLASYICGVPTALVTLIDEHRQWFKSRRGIVTMPETPRVYAFCNVAIQQPDQVLEVGDATRDRRFANNPFVTGDPGVRFYAGAPLVVEGGHALGTICVIDQVPRQLTDEQRRALQALARIVVTQLSLRKAARESSRLAAVVDSSDDAIYTRTPDDHVSSWNAAAEQLFGWTADEVIGRSHDMLVPPERRGEGGENLRTVFEGGRVLHHHTERMTKSGRRTPVSLSLSPVVIGTEIVAACTIARDITEPQRLHDELRRAHEEAVHATQMKSAFLANMSHELRTPMNAIIGMSALLDDSALPPEQQGMARTIRDSAESLLALINDVLDFSKLEAGKMRVDVADLSIGATVESVVDMLAEHVRRKGLDLGVFVDPAIPAAVRGDANRVRQVLVNLIGNAIKFTDQGHISVDVTLESRLAHGLRVRFQVSDSGVGIQPDAQRELFQPFVQENTSRTRTIAGTGLGLAISRHLVELMGGEIGLTSEPGRGSTFWFTINVEESQASPEETPTNVAALEGLRLLVVDDSPANRILLTRQLSAWRMDSAAVGSVADALTELQSAKGRSRPYDAVIVDHQLPDGPAEWLLAQVRAGSTPAPPLLLVTPAAVTEGSHFAAVLRKPVKQSTLFDAIADVAGRRTTAAPGAAADPNAPLAGTVLVAEDNSVNQRVLLMMLKRLGIDADLAQTGAEAVEAVQRRPYGLVLMDIRMPVMDGYEATRAIREHGGARAAVPIVALTADAQESDRVAAIAAGMNDYLSKPVRLDLLEAALRKWLAPPPA